MKDSAPNPLSPDAIVAIDRAHIWHPYSSFLQPSPVYPVASASGVHLHLSNGRTLVDGMASWWSALHGYNHPVLNRAVTDQLQDMAHVMFGGLTHEPAARLCQLLVDIAPTGLNKVFLADSGSVAVEVALKMAMQYHHSLGHPEKHRFLALRNGYHGDTYHAMSVCDPVTGMHQLFSKTLPHNIFSESPRCRFDAPWDDDYLADMARLLDIHHQELAAVILEPIVQGTGGMRFYSPEYLKRVRGLCDHYDVLLIADEIATGFGRTGKLFACEWADISPDILCIGKAMTGGYLTQAATLCNDRVSGGICRGEAGVFMHGPTFMGNPLASAVSLASIQLLLDNDWSAQVSRIERQLREELESCRQLPAVADVRVLGAIGVVELHQPVQLADIQPKFVERGIWVRPFGKLVYVMPPYIIQPDELRQLTEGIHQVVATL